MAVFSRLVQLTIDFCSFIVSFSLIAFQISHNKAILRQKHNKAAEPFHTSSGQSPGFPCIYLAYWVQNHVSIHARAQLPGFRAKKPPKWENLEHDIKKYWNNLPSNKYRNRALSPFENRFSFRARNKSTGQGQASPLAPPSCITC